MTPDARRRRSGPDLESALLTAAWDELIEAGYGRLTMGSVAARARTSEPVLYRRWANKDELVVAALERRRVATPIGDPDTGSLRGDLLAQLTAAAAALGGFYAVTAAASLSGLMAGTGSTPAQVRDRILGDRAAPRIRPLYQRAHDRGEIDLATIPHAALELPFELLRHDLLMHLEAPAPARIRSIVDELTLPLLIPAQRGGPDPD
jgi:AcrR family transcriptional regulator